MLTADNLNKRNSVLPFIGLILKQRRNKLNEPIRSVRAVDSVFNGGNLEGPVAVIYCVTYQSGTEREVFALMDSRFNGMVESAVFLKPGRVSDQLHEVRQLMIEGEEGIVPDSIKERLRRYDLANDQSNTQLRLG